VKLQHKFRASSLAEIMTDPKGKDEVLSVGAKTACEKLAKQFVYGYDEVVTGKYMDKGIQVEDQSIALVNQVFFTNYKKNTERKTNDWITGECDLIIPKVKVIDVKSSWSLATFPATSRAGEDKTYEWQGRAYMWLWGVPEFEINYCLVNTPDELIGYEDTAMHYVDHIEPELRVTRVIYQRDIALEEKMKAKVEAAQKLINTLIDQIAHEHNY
jgi:hypothetical protein